MKILLTILSLVSISTSAFASANCDKAAINIAKMNLDSKAKAYGFSESSINDSPLKELSSAKKDDSAIYSIEGYIYKSTYNVRVSLDSSCGVDSVTITEAQ